MIKNTPIGKVFPDKANPRKADQARLGLLRLSLAKLGFTSTIGLLSGVAIGAHTLLSRHIREEEGSSCILWVGRTNRGGYGRIEFMGQDWLAHRLSYTTYIGEIPEGLSVLHSCDTPGCINPAHLTAGTRADNVEDAASKGRMVHGEEHHASVLTVERVRYIRGSSKKHTELADELGVHPVTILNVRNRQTWRHV